MTEKDFKKMWDNWLTDIDLHTADIAVQIGDKPPNLQKKIRQQTIRYVELANIVEKYGYSIEIHKKT